MSSLRTRPLSFAGLALMAAISPCAAEEAKALAQRPSSAIATPPASATNPFSDKATSGQPCETFGPCGRCDCPPATVGKSGAPQSTKPEK